MTITNQVDITGAEIKAYRSRNGLTQSDLAKQIGVSYITIQNYEKGKNIPSGKQELFRSLFNQEQAKISTPNVSDSLKTALEEKFKDITPEEIGIYINLFEEKMLRKSKTFNRYIQEKATSMALDIIKKQ